MLQIRDEWGKLLYENESYEEVIKWGKAYKKKHKIDNLMVAKKNGGFHSFI